MYALFENIQKSKLYEYKFQASLHGVELKDTNNHVDKSENVGTVPFFSDPKDFDHLSKSEKEEMTAKMISKHKSWSNGGILK